MAKPNFTLPNKPAIKSGSILSYNYTDDFTFVPAELSFSRNGDATIVNSKNLIETVSANTPRIDYSDSLTEPSLLLEPQSTNLIVYSEQFDNAYWTKTRLNAFGSGSIVNAIEAPDGTTSADYIQQETGQTTGGAVSLNLSISGAHSWSVFAKASEFQFLAIRTRGATLSISYFDLTNGTVALADPDHSNVQITSFGNGWYRCSLSDAGGALANRFIVGGRDGANETVTPERGVYIWGAQLEARSYATSYIPTAGSTATRLGETANNAGDVNVFNSEEGVLYAEIAALSNDNTVRMIQISDGSNGNRVIVYYKNGGTINGAVASGGSTVADIPFSATFTNTNKVAIRYKLNNVSLWINGLKLGEDLSANSPIGLDRLNFNQDGGANYFYGKVKNVQVFNKALTDRELEILTIQ